MLLTPMHKRSLAKRVSSGGGSTGRRGVELGSANPSTIKTVGIFQLLSEAKISPKTGSYITT